MTRRVLLLLPFGIVLALPALAADEPKAKFTADLKKKDDTFGAVQMKDTVVFRITSPSGIGSGAIKREGGEWPQPIVVEFTGMKNLEMIQFKKPGVVFKGESIKDGTIYYDKAGKAGDDPKTAPYAITVKREGDKMIVTFRIPAEDATKVDRWDLEWVNEYR